MATTTAQKAVSRLLAKRQPLRKPCGAFQLELEVIARKHAGRGPQSGIFCDGSFFGTNQIGYGGWGVCHVEDSKILWTAHGREFGVACSAKTMELSALLAALHRIPEDAKVTLFSDSKDCVAMLLSGPQPSPVQSKVQSSHQPSRGAQGTLAELAEEARNLKALRPGVSINWLRGHVGNTWNEYADQLARSHAEAALHTVCEIDPRADGRPPGERDRAAAGARDMTVRLFR